MLNAPINDPLFRGTGGIPDPKSLINVPSWVAWLNSLTSNINAAQPATTVTDETTYGIAKAVGTSLLYARQDHTHGSPSSQLIFDTTVTGSAVTSVTTNGVVTLDGLAHGGYRAEITVVAPVGGGNYSVYVNGDLTSTNYNRWNNFGAAVNDALFTGAFAGNFHADQTIHIDPIGYVSFNTLIIQFRTSTNQAFYSTAKVATVANLTRLDWVGPANGFGVGSRIRLWRNLQ